MRQFLVSTLILISCTSSTDLLTLSNPAEGESSLPRLYSDGQYGVVMSWVEERKDSAFLYYSVFEERDWSEPKLLASSDNWFVNWADFPSVISRDGKLMAAHWLSKSSGGTYSYDVTIATYLDQKQSSVLVPHNDETPTEHGFVSMQDVSDSTFYAIWLDGRNTARGQGSYSAESDKLASAMTLRGALINREGDILEHAKIDASVCDCCNTSLALSGDVMFAAYRNRTGNEIRDIHFAKHENGEWTQLGSVHDDGWQIAACPVNGPAIDASGNTLAAAWFTGAGGKPVVKLAFSDISGKQFGTPFILDEEQPLGRVDLELREDETAWVSWLTRNGNTAQIVIRLIDANGTIIREHLIPDIDPSRAIGFPQISSHKDGLLIAWTEVTQDSSSVQTAIIRQ